MNGRSDEHISHSEALGLVEAKITLACLQAARPRNSVRLLAVSKTFPAEDVLDFARLGLRAFGENYLQESLDKQARCRELEPALSETLEWHFIGPLQSNKTRPVAEHFSWVHAIEREKIAQRLIEQRPAGLPPLNLCLQVNISGEETKSGVKPGDVVALALSVAGLIAQRKVAAAQAGTAEAAGGTCALRGLMCIPEPAEKEAEQRKPFAALRQLQASVRQALEKQFPDQAKIFDTLSMGMSADLQAAVQEGAGIVRIGSALFGTRDGSRPPGLRQSN